MREGAGRSFRWPDAPTCSARHVSLSPRLLLAMACLLAISAPVTSPATGQASQVRGRVVDGSNASAVLSAFVTVDGTPAYDLTDEDGRFVLDLAGELPPNTDLRVSALGYIPLVLSLDATHADGIVVTLQPRPIWLEGIEAEVGSYQPASLASQRRKAEGGNGMGRLRRGRAHGR